MFSPLTSRITCNRDLQGNNVLASITKTSEFWVGQTSIQISYGNTESYNGNPSLTLYLSITVFVSSILTSNVSINFTSITRNKLYSIKFAPLWIVELKFCCLPRIWSGILIAFVYILFLSVQATVIHWDSITWQYYL